MNFARKKQQEEICQNIDFRNFKENTKSILLINEPFGTGKTFLIDGLIEKIKKEKIVDILITFQNEEKASFFTEILAGSQIEFVSHHDQSVLVFNETNYNYNQFREILIDLKKTDNELFSRLTNFLILKSFSQYFDFNSLIKYDNEKEHLIEQIDKLLPSKGIQRLIFESGKVVIESFIIDLLNIFYPINQEQRLEDYVGQVQKPNITIILDDYESIGFCVNKWLIEDFFYYVFKAKLEDFIAFDLKNISGNLKVADFFDFKFVVSTREQLMTSERFRKIHHFENQIHRVDLQQLSKNEILEIINNEKINITENQFGFDKISKGNFSSLSILINQFKEKSDIDINELTTRLTDLILEFHSEKHKNWIIAASHLDIIEEQGLRCFPHISDEFIEVLEYLKNSSDLLVEESYKKGIIEFEPIIKDTLRKYLKIDSIQTSIEYENIIKSYNDVKDIIRKLNYEELESIRDLAYFRKINLDINLEREIAKNLEIVKKLKEQNPDWFITNKHSVSLSVSILNNIKKYNILIDYDTKKLKEDRAKKLWEDYANQLKNEIQNSNIQIEELSKKKGDINKGEFSFKQTYDEHQKGLMEKENKLIELKKRLSTFSTTKPITAALTNVGLAVLVIIISIIFPKIFENIENESSIFAIQIILYILSLVFFGFSGIFVYKLVQIYKSKNTIDELNKYIQRIEEEKEQVQSEMKRINSEKELIPRKMDDIGSQIAGLKEKIKVFNEKLNESFI